MEKSVCRVEVGVRWIWRGTLGGLLERTYSQLAPPAGVEPTTYRLGDYSGKNKRPRGKT